MKKKLMTVLALVLVIAMSVAGTYAYLTSRDTVTNTFTVGKVAITLDEAKVNDAGSPVDGAGRVAGNEYKLMPGHNYTKDPVVHFQADSEASYLFVKVDNGIAAIEADTNTIEAQILANKWVKLEVDGTVVPGVYYKQVAANTTDNAVDYPVFGEFTIKTDAVTTGYETAKVVVTAYAIQLDGFEDNVAGAWAEVSK